MHGKIFTLIANYHISKWNYSAAAAGIHALYATITSATTVWYFCVTQRSHRTLTSWLARSTITRIYQCTFLSKEHFLSSTINKKHFSYVQQVEFWTGLQAECGWAMYTSPCYTQYIHTYSPVTLPSYITPCGKSRCCNPAHKFTSLSQIHKTRHPSLQNQCKNTVFRRSGLKPAPAEHTVLRNRTTELQHATSQWQVWCWQPRSSNRGWHRKTASDCHTKSSRRLQRPTAGPWEIVLDGFAHTICTSLPLCEQADSSILMATDNNSPHYPPLRIHFSHFLLQILPYTLRNSTFTFDL